MNVYDQAHKLADAIKASEEFKRYDDVRKRVEANPDLDSAIKDFTKKQFELQTAQMMGNEIDMEKFQQIQQLGAVLLQDPLTNEFFQCQMRFSTMMADVYKILGDVADFGLGPMGDFGSLR
ncbi:MAG: YlbF family regulator [Firmicutes bacterium]|nr:YlbF family regulator [Bacillota bacterium]